jgi:hypothetical protein
MGLPDEVLELTKRFDRHRESYLSGHMAEADSVNSAIPSFAKRGEGRFAE